MIILFIFQVRKLRYRVFLVPLKVTRQRYPDQAPAGANVPRGKYWILNPSQVPGLDQALCLHGGGLFYDTLTYRCWFHGRGLSLG